MNNLNIIILAAGFGKRMNSNIPKALIKTRKKEMLGHILDTALELNPNKIIIVYGYKKDLVKDYVNTNYSDIKNIHFAHQEIVDGTASAIKCTLEFINPTQDCTNIIINGDCPLIRKETLQDFVVQHEDLHSDVSVLSMELDNPKSYGRIIKSNDAAHKLEKITEFKDCNFIQRSIREVNTGIYAVSSKFLNFSIPKVQNKNVKKEYYLTDIIEIGVKHNKNVHVYKILNSEEAIGPNQPQELLETNKILLKRKLEKLNESGVIFDDINTCYLDEEVIIEKNVHIGPNVTIKGKSIIKEETFIEGNAYIINSKIGKNNHIKYSVRVEESEIKDYCALGPFLQIRPNSVIEDKVKLGNFVEIKASHIKKSSKVNHLSYVGNTNIGTNTNIGAGTITCNYDGVNKHQTNIGDNVFIGSNSILIAPINIGNDSYTGAGTVTNKDIPNKTLVITRAKRVDKDLK